MTSQANPIDLAARSLDAYSSLAAEYYIPDRHPTCAIFNAIQDELLGSFASLVSGSGSAEVGGVGGEAGDGSFWLMMLPQGGRGRGKG